MKNIFLSLAMLILFNLTVAFAAPKAPVMNAAGRVLEISETSLKIERAVKGETEVMEFVLERPLQDIEIGAQMKISYKQKDMKYILIRAQKAKKTVVAKPVKKGIGRVFNSTAPETAPIVK